MRRWAPERAELRSASTMPGGLCVTNCLIALMLEYFVTNWKDFRMVVSYHLMKCTRCHSISCTHLLLAIYFTVKGRGISTANPITLFYAGAIAFSGSQFGQSDGPIFLDKLVCSSDDMSLLECPKRSPVGVISCDQSQTAGARCYGMYVCSLSVCSYLHLCNPCTVTADTNECALNTDDCAHNCSNTIGSYTCSCETGYSLDDDHHGCTGM